MNTEATENNEMAPKDVVVENSTETTEPQKVVVEDSTESTSPAEVVVEVSTENTSPIESVVEVPTESTTPKASVVEKSIEATTPVNSYATMSHKELISTLKELMKSPSVFAVRKEVESLKYNFYKNTPKVPEPTEENKEEISAIGNKFVEEEKEFKALLKQYKENKAKEQAEIDAKEMKNLEAKKAIIAKLKEMSDSPENLSDFVPEFKKCQAEWKSIGRIPKANEKEIWNEYNTFSEKCYDLVQIDQQLRDYDFEKNLTIKQGLIEKAKVLSEEEDILKAFQNLQDLHRQWRECGTVKRELREETWNKFKEYSTIINKKHQAFFEEIKQEEEKALKAKEAIIEQIKTIDLAALTNFKLWDEKTNFIKQLRDQFNEKSAKRYRHSSKVYKEFRIACDAFFKGKSEFYANIKLQMNENLEAKRKLCEIAESLQDSKEWKQTTQKLIDLQKEWKTIGPTTRKHSDAIWKRFTTACDVFFAEKKKNFSSKKDDEIHNLNKKLEIIEKLKAFKDVKSSDLDSAQLKALVDEFNAIGHVPFKEKDNVYQAYKEISDLLFDGIRSTQRTHRIDKMGSNPNFLQRQFETLKREINTYENNLGFFSNSNSKTPNPLQVEMTRKLDNLKKDLAAIRKKMQASDHR